MAAETLYQAGKLSVQEICDQLNITKPTLYACLQQRRVETGARNMGAPRPPKGKQNVKKAS
jgi:excisionase family DNA binding protein